MAADSDRRGGSPDPLGDRPTFVLETFRWGAPDRLEVAGTFSGIAEVPVAEPVLAVQGEDGIHRLPAIAQDDPGQPVDGARWTAAFAWVEAPVAFDRARLELGADLAVDLPAPGETAAGDPLPVEPASERESERDAAAPPASESNGAAPAAPEAPGMPSDVEDAAQRLRLEAQLLEETEELEEARATAQRAAEALIRVQADLEAERKRHAADAERFREGLAKVRVSAEAAVEAAADARTRAVEQAEAEIAALHEKLEALEPAGAELAATRVELDVARGELDDARGERDAARSELDDARGERDAARSELDDVRGELDDARSERDAARSEVDDFRGELDAARSALAEVRGGVQDLLERLAHVSGSPTGGR